MEGGEGGLKGGNRGARGSGGIKGSGWGGGFGWGWVCWCGWGGERLGVLEEGFADGAGDEAADGAFLAEFHLAFGRVDIDVDGGGIDFEEETADGVTTLHEGGVIALGEGVVEAPVFDGAPVDEQVLFVAGGARDTGSADQTPEMEPGEVGFAKGGGVGVIGADVFLDLGGEVEGDPIRGGAVELTEAFAEGGELFGAGIGAERGQLPDGAGIGDEVEADGGMGEGGEGEVVLDVGTFGFLGAEEFATGREVEEQGADLDGSAGGAGGGADFGDAPALDGDGSGFAGGFLAFAGGEEETGDRSDGREGFAPEAHGGEGGEILGPSDLGGGMTFEREEGVIAAHPESIVGDADEAASTGPDFDGDAGGLGVEGILDEFLDDGSGSFNDFAGGDLIGDVIWEETDAVHDGDSAGEVGDAVGSGQER